MKTNSIPYAIIGLIAFLYVAARAFLMDVTFDEAATIRGFSVRSYEEIISCSSCLANNHILNTVLIKFFRGIFGESLFVCRLPNVIGFLFYLFFSYRIADRYFKNIPGILFFIALFCNPFLLDFFGLARGYGLAITLMLISIYYILRFLENYDHKYAYYSLIAASFSVTSNLTLLNYWLGAFFLIHFSYFFNKSMGKGFRKLLGINAITTLILIAFLYEPVRRLLKHEGFLFGGFWGFYPDTLTTLTAFSRYLPYNFGDAMFYLNIALGLMAFIVIFSMIGSFKFRDLISQRKYLLSLVLIIPILSNITQFHLLGTYYLIERTALFYYPLFIIVFFFFGNDINKKEFGIVSKIWAIIICSTLIYNQIKNSNLFKTITWDHDSKTTEILDHLNEKGKKENRTILLGSSWLFQNSVEFYFSRRNYSHVTYRKTDDPKIEPRPDYYLHYTKPLFKVGYIHTEQPVLKYEKKTELEYPEEGIYLFGDIIIENEEQ